MNAHSRGFAGTLIDRSDHHTRRHRVGKRQTAYAGVERLWRAGRPPVQKACTSGARRRSTSLCQVRMRVSLLRRSRPGRMYQAVMQTPGIEVGRPIPHSTAPLHRSSAEQVEQVRKQPSPTLRAKVRQSAQTQQGRIHRAQTVGPNL